MSENITTYYRYTTNYVNFNQEIVDFFGGNHQRPPAQYTPNDIFGNAVYKIIRDECTNLYKLGYTPWIQEAHPDNDPDYPYWQTDIDRFKSYIFRQFQLKYKYFDYFKNKWSLENLGGLTENTVETLDRTIEKSGTVAKDTTTTKSHDSTTDNTYTVDSEISDSGSISSKTADENSPLGTSLAADITTPSMKTSGTQTDSNTSTTDRTDTTHLVVDSDDSISENVEKTTTDTADDDYTKTKEFSNGIEALKAIRYLDYSIVDVITEIIDSTCKELNEFI